MPEITAYTERIYREAVEKGREIGRKEERISAIAYLLDFGCSEEKCLELGYTDEEIAQAKAKHETNDYKEE